MKKKTTENRIFSASGTKKGALCFFNVIKQEIDVTFEELSLDEAHEKGAYGIFDSKYGDKVKVYTIGDVDKQICGGPHAKNTRDLHHFKIIKEESSSSGIRRIKAILD